LKHKALALSRIAGFAAIASLGAFPTHRVSATAPPVPALVLHLREVDTAVNQVDNPPKGTSAGDLITFVARVSSSGKRVGREVGNCAYVTRTEIFCSVDFDMWGQGRIELAGELSTQKPDSVFPITGGSGRFTLARGYLTNHQTATASYADQVLHVYQP